MTGQNKGINVQSPSVSVFLPVYNGETHIDEAINSVCEQTFENFELIISDNASTDDTHAICVRAATRDCRIRYYRNDVNHGLAANFNRAPELANGRYLVWICHDDRMKRNYIQKCIEVIEDDHEAVLCFTNAEHIDVDGEQIKSLDIPDIYAAEAPSERFRNILYVDTPIWGLMKMEVFRQVQLLSAYADSDRVLLAEMAFRGRFRKIPQCLFSRRIHPLQATANRDRWQRSLSFDQQIERKIVCPWWWQLSELAGAIHRAPISWRERMNSYKYLYWWSLVHRPFLYQDLRRALECVLKPIRFPRF